MRVLKPDSNGNPRLGFNGKLLSMSKNTLTNINGKNYKVCTIEFADKTGKIQKSSAFCFEGNYQYGMEIDEEYLCTATLLGGADIIINVSHLTAMGDRPTADMFDFVGEAVTAGTFDQE